MQDFTIETIRGYLLAQGGRVEYHRLIQYFKQSLKDQESRLYFKDSVNKLADVVTDNNAKFLVLKHDQYFCSDDSPVQETKPFEPVLRKHHAPPVPAIMQPNIPQRARPMSVSDNEARGYTNKSIPPANIQDNRKVYQPAPPYNAHKHSNQNLPLHSVNNGNQQLMSQQTTYNAVAVNWSPLQQADQPPQPPPRRRTSSNSGLSGSSFATKHGNVDEKVVQLHEGDHLEKEKLIKSPVHQDEKLKEIHELARTPGRVKEHAEKWNKMTSESDLKVLVTPSPEQSASNRNSQSEKDGDTDSGSVNQPLDPLRKRWMVAAALTDTPELASMLKEDAKLADFKDITSTALHWASKFGKEDLVELLAGRYFVNVNAKSGGYTSLHLAIMFSHLNIKDLLLKYHADPNIRDHSGKLPKHYLKQSKENMKTKMPEIETKSKQHKLQFGPSNSHKIGSRPSSESLPTAAFHRIGSLYKLKKTAKTITGKTWGSSESVNDTNLMPAPKSKLSKKKKAKQRSNSTTLETVVASNSNNSDSDYGFGH